MITDSAATTCPVAQRGRCMANNHTSILTYATHGYLHWLSHLHLNLHHLELDNVRPGFQATGCRYLALQAVEMRESSLHLAFDLLAGCRFY